MIVSKGDCYPKISLGQRIILWLFNIAMENGPFKTSICNGFSIAMLNNQMVLYCFPDGLFLVMFCIQH